MFQENKYTRWYLTIIEKAKNQKRKKKTRNEYYEAHHIIPRCMGGKEVVLLTAKEHFICHLLLCKMTIGENKHKMINALIKMSFSKSNGQKRYVAKSYELVKKMIAEKNVEMFKGKPKSKRARKNMKGHSGTWIRTEEYCKKLSNIRKGKQKGEDNPFYGKTHSEKQKKKWSSDPRRKFYGNTATKGKIWITNGTEDKMVYKDNIPKGFYLGRTKNKRGDNNELATQEQTENRSS